jgi:diaminopimelate epimerase
MQFSKWHGLGNDYLLVERAELALPLTPERVQKICDYHFGVGSDGIVEVLSTNGDGAEVVIWNPDGSTAELSGNGARIAARWLARRNGVDRVRISVGPRVVVATMRDGKQVETEMGKVEVGEKEPLQVDGKEYEMVPVSVGNPHAVIRLAPERDEFLQLGPAVENHVRFPERTNVQFAHVDSPHDVTAVVWERGAGETLSSGTSAVAVASAAVHHGWCESPVTVHLQGGDLLVELDAEYSARLTGPAEEICSVRLSEEFEL